MTKFGYESLNFAKMFTLPINAKRENFAFFDNTWLQSNLKSLKSSKLPIYDIFASLLYYFVFGLSVQRGGRGLLLLKLYSIIQCHYVVSNVYTCMSYHVYVEKPENSCYM